MIQTDATQEIETQPQRSVGWGPIVGVVYSLGVAFIGGAFVAGIVLGIALTLFGMDQNALGDWLASPFGAFVYSLLSAIISVGAIALYVKKSRSGLSSIGLTSFRWKYIWMAVAAVAVYFMLYVLIVSVLKGLIPALDLEQQQDLGITTPHGFMEMVLVFLTLVVLPPIVEETIFRGFMFGGLRKKLPFVAAAIITSVLFAVGHLQFGNAAPLLWVAAIDTFILSTVMCYVRERTGSIAPTILMHALKNLLAFSVLYIFVS